MREESFKEFMRKVDDEIERRCGMTHQDIDDWGYAAAFDRGESAVQAAQKAIKAAKKSSGM